MLITASEPGGEGRTLAAAIGACCIEDDAVARHLHRVDAVLVGADAVLDQGDVIHKIGTRAIAELAASRGVPFHVVFESSKRLPLAALEFDETVFDRTPANRITNHLTDAVFPL